MPSWTYSTYSGIDWTGQPSPLRTAIYEWMVGIDERYATLLQSPVSWAYMTSGPDYAELEGLVTTGTDSQLKTLLLQIQAQVKALINTGKFTESSGISARWNLSSMETAISHSLEDAPVSVRDAGFYQAIQDALNRLIYCGVSVGSTNPPGQVAEKWEPSGAFGDVTVGIGALGTTDDIEEAWDAVVAGSSTSWYPGAKITMSIYHTYVRYPHPVDDDFSEAYTSPVIIDNVDDVAVVVPAYLGTITAATTQVAVTEVTTPSQGTAALTGSVAAEIFGGVFTDSNGSNPVTIDHTQFSFGATANSVLAWQSWPGSAPFTAPTVATGYTMSVTATHGLTAIYFDIASELSDQ